MSIERNKKTKFACVLLCCLRICNQLCKHELQKIFSKQKEIKHGLF